MTTHLLIAGHGKKRDGTFDPGATGFIKKGENKYMSEDLFPAMKNIVSSDDNIIFFDEYNVYDRGNVVALAKELGADEVTEFHYDATGSKDARGGHVIIHKDYSPDKVDLALRDAIEDVIGVRYEHKGHKGISGRDNLANVNRAKSGKLTYRLIEIGFGTNKEDASIMVDKVDDVAKALVEALTGSAKSTPKPKPRPKATPKPKAEPKPKAPKKKSISVMADEVIAGEHGNGHVNRRKSLGITQTEYEKVRAEVNRRAGVKPKAKPKAKKIYTKGANATSIVDFLKLNGKDSSFTARGKLARANGISNYRGTGVQNTRLLNILKKQ